MVRFLTLSKSIIILSGRKNKHTKVRPTAHAAGDDDHNSPRHKHLHHVDTIRQQALEGAYLDDPDLIEQDALAQSFGRDSVASQDSEDGMQLDLKGSRSFRGPRPLRKQATKNSLDLSGTDGHGSRTRGFRGPRPLKKQASREFLFHSLSIRRKNGKVQFLRRHVSDRDSPDRQSPLENISAMERIVIARLEKRRQALERFRKLVKTILLLRKAFGKIREKPKETDWKFLSWTVIYDDLGLSRRNFDHHGLTFDPSLFKANREIHLSSEAKAILSKDPEERTPDQLSLALASLMTTNQAFKEFPIQMRQSLVKVGWYEHFEAGRVIIRQGHYAENFYFILSGTAVVTILETNRQNGEQYVRTANILKKGSSFGELALMHGSKRTATVTVRDDVELFAVGRQDYVDIFMPPMRGQEPDHFRFLRSVDVLKGWPVDALPTNDPRVCVFTYVRRGVLLCRDSNETSWIYVIVTGTCRVIKAMESPRTSLNVNRTSLNASRTSLNTSSTSSTPRRHAAPRPMGERPGRLPPLPSVPEVPTSPVLAARGRTRRVGVYHKQHPATLPPILGLSHQDLSEEAEHRRQLDDIYYKRHVLPSILNESPGLEDGTIPEDGQSLKGDNRGEQVFLEITKLVNGDVFGLEQIVLKDLGEITSSSVVSEGAEVVLIDKKFFTKHLSEDTAKRIRRIIQPLPSKKTLQQKLQNQTDWEAYKRATISHHYRERHHHQDIVTLRN